MAIASNGHTLYGNPPRTGRNAKSGEVFQMMLPILLLVTALSGDSPRQSAVDSADTAGSKDLVCELGTMVVSASRMAPPASIQEISADDIRERNACSVVDALEGARGVTVTRGAKGETDVYLRGMDSRRTLVLLDGRPVNMPYYGNIDLHTISIDNVSRIVVTKGAPSLLYGVNGTAGTINIITKRPQDVDGYRIGARGSVGNNATVGGRAHGELRAGKTSLSASVNKEISDGFSLSRQYIANAVENGGLRDNTDYNRINIAGKLGTCFNDDNEAAIAAGYYRDNRGVPIDTRLPQYRRFPEWKRSYIDATGRMRAIGDTWIKAKLFYDNFHNILYQWTDAVNGLSDTANSPSIHKHWDAGGVTQLHVPWRGHNICIAANGKYEIAGVEGWDGKPNTSYAMQTVAGAVEDAYTFGAIPVTVSGGVGCSFVRCEGRRNARGYFEKSSADARLGLSCSFTEEITAYMSSGAYTRYPTIQQLFSSEYANAALKTERSLKLGAGVTWTFRSWFDISADAYTENYKDLIDRRTADTVLAYVNISSAWSRGVECGYAAVLPKTHTRFRGGYTLSATHDDARNLPLPYIPLHAVKAGITQPFLGNGKAFFSVRWALRRYNESSFGQLLDNYAVANGRLSYRWRFLEGSFAVDNIFDKNYTTESVGYPMPGRTFYGEIDLSFSGYFRGGKTAP